MAPPARVIIALVAFACLVEAQVRVTKDHQRMSENDAAKMPDFSNPEDAKELKCSGCQALADEFYASLKHIRGIRGKNIKQWDIEEAVDSVCETKTGVYGLQVRYDKPTTIFSKNDAVKRAQGFWIMPYLQNLCAAIAEDHQTAILAHPEGETKDQYMARLCTRAAKMCPDARRRDDSMAPSTKSIQEEEVTLF